MNQKSLWELTHLTKHSKLAVKAASELSVNLLVK